MSEEATAVVDTNVLLNLATPVVDARNRSPSGEDPLKAFLTSYDVHAPASVLGEVTEASGQEDLLAAAAELVLQATQSITTHAVTDRIDEPLDYGLDTGESEGIWLANEIEADLFVTDEFSIPNYLFINLALDDRNTLFTTPHILCTLGCHDILRDEYVNAALTYYVETKGWEVHYVEQLRNRYFKDNAEC